MYLFRYKIHVYTYNSLRHLWMQLRGQVQPFGPGAGGIVWDGAVPGSRGWDKWKISSLWFCVIRVISFTVYTMATDLKITYFWRQTQEFWNSPQSSFKNRRKCIWCALSAALPQKRWGWPHFLFYDFNKNSSSFKWGQNWYKSMFSFFRGAILLNCTDWAITSWKARAQIKSTLERK